MIDYSEPLPFWTEAACKAGRGAMPHNSMLNMGAMADHHGITTNPLNTFYTAYGKMERAYLTQARAMDARGEPVPWVMPVEMTVGEKAYTIFCGYQSHNTRNRFGVLPQSADDALAIRNTIAAKVKRPKPQVEQIEVVEAPAKPAMLTMNAMAKRLNVGQSPGSALCKLYDKAKVIYDAAVKASLAKGEPVPDVMEITVDERILHVGLVKGGRHHSFCIAENDEVAVKDIIKGRKAAADDRREHHHRMLTGQATESTNARKAGLDRGYRRDY